MTSRYAPPSRPPAVAGEAMAATSHPTATLAALDAMREGGNAIDAALAASAVLAVIEPHMTGIGGDCFALIAEPDGSLSALNGSGRSGAATSLDAARGASRIEPGSGLAVTVPGAVDAWCELAERGRLGLGRLLAPAIRVAREGFNVSGRVAADWAGLGDYLVADEGARTHYLPGSTPPRMGERVALPALADTLERIAREGRSAFYEGEVAKEIVALVRANGGTLGEDDLAAYRCEWVEPLRRPYRDCEAVEMPPANQGVTALAMLGMLERFDVGAMDPVGADKLHLEVEAARLAYAQRDEALADPAAMTVSNDDLLLPDRLDAWARSIDMRRARPVAVPTRTDTDTVYLCTVDRDGRACSFINSLFTSFGSGLCTLRSGVMLQSRGAGFVLTPGHANALGSSKRPLHTLIPGMLMRDGRTLAAFGVMGGQYQAAGHAHLLTGLVDHGLDPQAALDTPRIFFEGRATVLEDGAEPSVREELARRGHDMRAPESPIGGGQAIWIDRERGALIGGSDARKDGCALGLG